MHADDELTTALIPVADRLISAVHAFDAEAVAGTPSPTRPASLVARSAVWRETTV
jgi:hypothetical protein